MPVRSKKLNRKLIKKKSLRKIRKLKGGGNLAIRSTLKELWLSLSNKIGGVFSSQTPATVTAEATAKAAPAPAAPAAPGAALSVE